MLIASAYQGLSYHSNNNAKKVLLDKSNIFFKKCLKLNPSDTLFQKAEFGVALNTLLLGNFKQVLQRLSPFDDSLGVSKIVEENKGLFYYLKSYCHLSLYNKEEGVKFLKKLEALNNDTWSKVAIKLKTQFEIKEYL